MKIAVSLFLLCFIFSCAETEEKPSFNSSIVANDENEKELESSLKDTKQEEQERLANFTEISMDKVLHDFGTIEADKDYNTYFEITNTGKKNLMIYDVKASCGCTVPTWNKNPISPGKKDKILVTFHPKPEQLGEMVKTITVLTNSDPGVEVLQIKSNVIPKKKQ